jgi:acetoin utilization deacetylase AcuC-like enzyme
MKVIFHEDFYQVYTSDPAAVKSRMEVVIDVIKNDVDFVTCKPASEDEISAAHTKSHINRVRKSDLYPISSLAAGGAVLTARTGLNEPAFGLLRPPGHHASAGDCWGFCYFNNMAIALLALKNEGLIENAFVLDFDMHFGDGTVNILGSKDWVKIHNPSEQYRDEYIRNVAHILSEIQVDIIGISAGFDNHEDDWGKILKTEDYYYMGSLVCNSARACNGGCFAILEGGYNHEVLGHNVAALIEGLSS